MQRYIPTIGLEIHAELKTRSKMFCSSSNDPDEKHPNMNICPVCMGHPGILPVINEDAIFKLLKVGLALNCEIPKWSKFDRKNYFYPDLPKGYQISQYDAPLCIGGYLDIQSEVKNQKSKIKSTDQKSKRIRIRRIHLEEDTGRLIHTEGGGYSLVDFNRAGVPLMELVTEPDINTAEEAVVFAKELQKILRYLEVSDADMEKGQLRVEVNISLQPSALQPSALQPSALQPSALQPLTTLGTKVEIKNLNSFRAVEKAISYEIARQTEILEKGEKVVQETRGFHDTKEVTFSQRTKEEAHDYRYFPEPDLPPLHLVLPLFDLESLRSSLPELPQAKRKRFQEQYGVEEEAREVLVQDKHIAHFFEETMSELLEWAHAKGIKTIDEPRLSRLAANYIISDLVRLIHETGTGVDSFVMTPENFAELLRHIYEGKISSRVAKDLLEEIFKTGADPSQLIQERGLLQISEVSQLEETVKRIVGTYPKAAEDYKKGKENALQFLIGKVIAETRGKANPMVVEDLLRKLLE